MNRLDLEGLSFSCFTSGAVVARYTCNILAFPLLAVWMWLCFAMSKLLPSRRLRWTPTKTLNSIGSLLQMGYGPMCMLALQPFMCYTHPNGSQSLLRQPGVFCGEGDHRAMLVGGCLLLVLIGFGSWSGCGFGYTQRIVQKQCGGDMLRWGEREAIWSTPLGTSGTGPCASPGSPM